ncbi:MAG: BPL-N domain-containing protein [Thermodesulfobacteriota bacterium]
MSRIPSPPIALLWDHSHIWGLLLQRALAAFGLPFSLVRGRDAPGVLLGEDPPRLLVVPGGFARKKLKALGPAGAEAVRRFVASGGAYLGICGGAGLALSDPDGLSLCPWRRAGFTNRIKHFISGHVLVAPQGPSDLIPDWLPERPQVPVWWPARFAPPPDQVPARGSEGVLAAYDAPGPDFMLADLDVAGLSAATLEGWRERFGLGLGPEFLGEGPCMIAGRFGRGRYVLSHAHLETPQSPQANAWLVHILAVLTGESPPAAPGPAVPAWDLAQGARRFDAPGLELAETLLNEVIELGIAHRLLFRRNTWLLGWRPGTPGFAVSNLRAMLRQAVRLPPTAAAEVCARENEARFLGVMRRFHAGACASFLDERLAATLSRFGRMALPEPVLARQRLELFGPPPGVGGMCGELLALLDDLVFRLLGG